uniref:Uncharacterized protein n=1 Tax=Trypanosoma vivax (strain Y486) TaxID=1055687 RepID=G0TYE8_TRYVY|nr:hypothetical protein, unlikely [Trypanosoma vivax Y486]
MSAWMLVPETFGTNEYNLFKDVLWWTCEEQRGKLKRTCVQVHWSVTTASGSPSFNHSKKERREISDKNGIDGISQPRHAILLTANKSRCQISSYIVSSPCA